MAATKQNAILNNEHNYGIDLLRITAMFMIVIIHLIGFFICAIANFIYYFIMEHLTIRISGKPNYTNLLMEYNSPLLLIQAIFALLFFLQIKIKNTPAAKIIIPLSASTFGVYAIH